MNWIAGLQNAIDYIENNLTEELDYTELHSWRIYQKQKAYACRQRAFVF